MSNPNDVPVVRFADEYIRLFYTKVWKHSLVALVIVTPLSWLVEWSGHRWLGIFIVAGVAWFYLMPRFRREHRFLSSLPCAHCGQAAGSYFSEKFVIHLRCQHCGKISRTDCMRLGHIPSKI